MLVVFPESTPISINRNERNRCRSETEFCQQYNLSFFLVGGYIDLVVASMQEMLIRFSFIFNRWTTTPTPPLELTDGFVATGCTVPFF
jgi:hypothetical protein